MAAVEQLLTAEEFLNSLDDGRPAELVRGRIVEMVPTGRRHGKACSKICFSLESHFLKHDAGIAATNDSGVVTERNPDTVRGPDVTFFSYQRLPRGAVPAGYEAVPEIVFEVRSPSDRPARILAKVAEFLEAGVLAACVVDPERQTVTVYEADGSHRILSGDQPLTFPNILPDYAAPVNRFFA